MENYQKTRMLERPSVCPFSALPPDTPEVRVRDGSKIRHALRYALSRMEAGPRGPARDEAGPRGPAGDEAGPRGPAGDEAGPRGPAGDEAGPRGPARDQREEAGPRGPAGAEARLEEDHLSAERPLCRQVVLTASGGAVSKAITCAEIVKRRVPGLHQVTRLQFCTVDEVWDPLEAGAGLDSLTVSRNLPCIWILLSRDELDRGQPGYQEPGRHGALWAREEDGGPRPGPAGPRPGPAGPRPGPAGPRPGPTGPRPGPTGPRPGHKRKKGGGGGRRQTGQSREPAKGQS